MVRAPSDHVRGDLVAPAIEWLGQLVVERRRTLRSLDPLLGARERSLLFAAPTLDDWVPVHVGRRILDAVVQVHGGRGSAVLRELARRSVPRIADLDGAPAERLSFRLDRLLRLGHWRRPQPRLPGDILELEAHRPCAPSVRDWVGGLVASSLPTDPDRMVQVAVRVESPRHFVFVRCVV